ncbi:MAG TPA: acyltransferase [Edaphobacter sp.]
MKHVVSLDGLRGAAALMVVAFHYLPRTGTGPFGQLASFGWIGVDIFFVLSGFLITSILYEQRGAEHYFRNFYMRRMLRLSPLYYFLFVMALVLTPVLHISWRPMQLAMLVYATNFILPVDDSLAKLGPFDLFHLWSLAVEEQFYLLWPWLVGSRLSKQSLQRICVAGIIAAPLLRLAMLHEHFQTLWLYQSLPARMDALLMGALLALVPRPSLRSAWLAAVVALGVFGATVAVGHSAFFQSPPIQGVGYSALAVLAGSILTMSLYPGSVAGRIFSLRPLRFYGRYSYGLYLWHYLFLGPFTSLRQWIVGHMASAWLGGMVSFAVTLLLSTLIALVSYHALEAPFLRLKKWFGVSTLAGKGKESGRGKTEDAELETAPGLH